MTSRPQTVGEALRAAVLACAKVNTQTSAPVAAIVWPDKDGQWASALPALRKLLPDLVTHGEYNPEERTGPAIWIKCAIANMLPETPIAGVPIVYLPGVGRSDLRDVENCARDLQPLAELQYRGVFWSQASAKDWTVNAFLASPSGGLGLDVAQDRATQDALSQALQAGVLLSCDVGNLRGRAINAEWLMSLLAPNPVRDMLQWMNDPEATQGAWGDVLWSVFTKRCKTDFGFSPEAEGILSAAERLAKGEGKWAAVSLLYKDSFGSFPNLYNLLAGLKPPLIDLFPDREQLSGYPAVNEQAESALRYDLSLCANADAAQARGIVLKAEENEGSRRDWLWSRMGQSPLADALKHLADLATRSATLPIGQTPAELAASYQQYGWQVDDAAMKALACVSTKVDIEAVSAVLRALYLPWSEEAARRLQDAARNAGGLPPLSPNDADDRVAGTCTVFVDGLRYDVAMRLQERLADLGATSMSASWTSLPSVTASGKAWCSPVSALIAGTCVDLEFEPRVKSDGKPLSTHNFRKLLTDQGVQALAKHETGDPKGLGWTEAGDLDHYGHEHGIRLARDIDLQLNGIVERVTELCEAGWKRIRLVTDHGWLLMPGGLPKSDLSKHQVETRWGRCAVLKDSAHGTSLTFGWDWCKDVQVAYAPGIASFVSGAEYAHGGISLQECLVPLVQLDRDGAADLGTPVSIQAIGWKGLRCNVTVEGAGDGASVDIRTKTTVASSSIVASPKPLVDGKASLAVADDDQIGVAAVVVVLGADGQVLQKQATTIGEP